MAVFREISFGQTNFPNQFLENPIKQELKLNVPFKSCWIFPFQTNVLTNIASDNESLIYIPFFNGEIVAVTSEFGTLTWKTDLGGQIVSDILVSGENLYVISKTDQNADEKINEKITGKKITEQNIEKNTEDSEVYKYTATIRSIHNSTGITVWEVKLPVSEKNFLYEYSHSLIVIDWEGFIYRIEKQSGRIIWKSKLESKLTATPHLELNALILGLSTNQIIDLSLDTGKVITKVRVPFEPTTVMSVKNDKKLFWGDRKGIVTSANWSSAKANTLKTNLKTNWKFRIGAEISHIVSTPEGLLISSFDNFVYLISEKSGRIIWKRRFVGRISFKPLVVGNFAVISVFAEPEAFVIETNSGRLVNKFSLTEDNFFIESPLRIKNKLFFPTLKGLFSFSQNECPENLLNKAG